MSPSSSNRRPGPSASLKTSGPYGATPEAVRVSMIGAQRAAAQPDELRRVEPRLQIFEAIRNRVALVPDRRQAQQLALGDDRRDLRDRDNEDLVAAADGNAFEVRRAR